MNTRSGIVALLASLAILSTPFDASAQDRKRKDRSTSEEPSLISVSVETAERIRAFYAERPAVGVRELPPGMRNRLVRGKPLPPGIARQVAPDALRSTMTLPGGVDLVEVGLDVILVEVATGIIHDVLRDVVR